MPPALYALEEDQPVHERSSYERISGLSVCLVPPCHVSLEGVMIRLVASLVVTEVLPEFGTP